MDETRLAINPTMEQEDEIEKKEYRVKVLGQRKKCHKGRDQL